MLATSSIAEGETRLAALESIIFAGGSIYSATSKSKWPGAANVFICRVSVSKRQWEGAFTLDGKCVKGISSFLTPDTNWQPVSLQENQGVAFYGAIPNGDGFFIPKAEAEALLTKSPDHHKVLYPFLTGKDLNSNPSQSASRFAINFWDWSEDVASKYSDAFEIVANRVKPYRATLKSTKPKLAEKWWIYEANPKGLHDAIGRSEHFRGGVTKTALNEVLVIARVSSTNAFTFVSPNQIFDCALIVVASDDFGVFAVLQSSIHFAFAWQHGGKMKSDLRYSPTMCLATFPFPKPDDFEGLRLAGRSFNEKRKGILTKRKWGLTRLSNSLHDSDCGDSDIQGLRSCLADLDMRVLEAYGWSDIALNHGFHHVDYLPAGRNLRYTISEPARIEILHRLADLNLQRHKEEANKNSIASDSAKNATKLGRKGKRTSSEPISDLFDGENA